MYRGVVCAGLIWSLCGPAAADPTAFAIPSQPLPQAVVAFGLQSGVSIGSGAAASCGRSRALRGRFEIEAGLAKGGYLRKKRAVTRAPRDRRASTP